MPHASWPIVSGNVFTCSRPSPRLTFKFRMKASCKRNSVHYIKCTCHKVNFDHERFVLYHLLLILLGMNAKNVVIAGDGGEKTESRMDIFQFDDLTVKARLREELLQEVPISITLIPKRDLEQLGYSDTTDIALHVPNLQLKTPFASTNPTIFLRGIGINDFNSNATTAVGVYVDDVYLGSSSGRFFQLFDLEAIEVLRGPQGTLYGRNTTGGAIKFESKKPRHVSDDQEPENHLKLRYGSFNETSIEGGMTLRLNERTASRVAFVSNHRDGYTRNRFLNKDVNDIDNWGARGLLSLDVNAELDILLKIHGGQSQPGASYQKSLGVNGGADELGYVDSNDPLEGAYNKKGKENINLFGSSLIANLDLNSLFITSISAYESVDRLSSQDNDSSPNSLLEIDFENDSWQFSQELQIKSINEDLFKWILGFYYFKEKIDAENEYDFRRENRPTPSFDPLNNGVFFVRQNYDQEIDSYAIFGQLEYELTQKNTLALGLRYTLEHREFKTTSAFEEPNFQLQFLQFKDQSNFDEVSGQLSIDHKFTENIFAYASFSRGFNSGGYNGGLVFTEDEAKPFDKEIISGYEAGLKSSWLDGRFVVNSSFFYYNYDDLQVFSLVNIPGISVPIQVLDNAADATVSGMEFELSVSPTDNLAIKLGIGLLDTEYDRFISGNNNFSGNTLVNAPETNFNGIFEYKLPIKSIGNFLFHTDITFIDDAFFDTTNNPIVSQKGYWLANARVSFLPEHKPYEIAFWGRNLGKTEYLVDAFDITDFGFYQLEFGAPRTYGIDVIVRF